MFPVSHSSVVHMLLARVQVVTSVAIGNYRLMFNDAALVLVLPYKLR